MRIIQAINSMIAKRDKIANVIRSKYRVDEYFFLYDGKYKWSIYYDPDEEVVYLNFYATESEIETLADLNNRQGIDIITYCSRDSTAREALESFNELYIIVKEKLFGVDKVLEDIIDDPPF